jgi:NADPH:quinone reductase-like Zn-dependent oxidoreductase
MLAAYAARFDPDDPVSALEVGERPDATPPADDWVVVRLKAAALNHHDLWSLRGVGLKDDQLPMILGCDGAGVTADGDEVVLHAVIGEPGNSPDGDETLDPGMSLLSEKHPGTIAELVAVPRRNLVPKPASLSWEEAACLPCAWLTAYKMLFTRGRVRPGSKVLVQGAGGGVATAAITLAAAAGATVYATSRDEAKLVRARELGAHVAVATGARLPDRVDVVIETVGEATWDHSLKALRPGGTLVVSGATSGHGPPADIRRLFARQINIAGSTMGTRWELESLIRFLESTGVRPLIDSVRPLSEAAEAFRVMAKGDVVGKLVLTSG